MAMPSIRYPQRTNLDRSAPDWAVLGGHLGTVIILLAVGQPRLCHYAGGMI